MFFRIIAMAVFWESSTKTSTLQYSVGVSKLSIERGFLVYNWDGLLSVIQSSGMSRISNVLKSMRSDWDFQNCLLYYRGWSAIRGVH